jgi:4-hydroxy-tetrahydrodipicolinate synthase
MENRPASTFVISLTPFAADGSLDEEGFRAHLRRLAASGIGVYVGGSGSGEGYVLSAAERRRVLEIASEVLSGRVPARAMGVEPRSSAEMIAYGREVAAAGLDAMQVYSLDQGHGYRPRPEELEAYLSDVLDAVSIPAVLSSHQAMGYDIPAELVAKLIETYPHLIGISFTHGDVRALVRMLDAVDGRIDVHVGGPMQAITALALGAQGYLSSEGNLAPRLCVSVIEAHCRGELALRDDAFAKVLRLFDATQRGGGMSATKGALRLLGLPGGWPRRPRLPVSDSVAKEMVGVFEALGLRDVEEL